VTRDEAIAAVTNSLHDLYGRLVAVRDLRPVRRAAGVSWQFRVVAPSSDGELALFDLELDEFGEIAPRPSIAEVVDAIRASVPAPPPSIGALRASTTGGASLRTSSTNLGNVGSVGRVPVAAPAPPPEEDDELAGLFDEPTPESDAASAEDLDALRARVKTLLESESPRDHELARSLLPRLLIDPERRAITLVWLAEIERRLGDTTAALAHLEAAARDFAQRFQIPALERCAAIAMGLMPRGAFAGSLVHRLVESARARVRPLQSLWEAGPFAAVEPENRAWLALHADLRPLEPGELLMREGAPARAVFVVRAGLLSVNIERPDGGEQRVRYCHPGWVLGEASVLAHDRPTATETLRAEGPAEVWVIAADAIRRVMARDRSLRQRLSATKHLNRLDSFLTTHPELGTLEVLARDGVMHALATVEEHDEPTVVMEANATPNAALLVASGQISLHDEGAEHAPPRAVLGADSFVGVRDALHLTPSPFTVVARPGATLVWFDGDKLRALAGSDPRIAAVLERVG
jgi:CRP-like cAMP-binding protein